MNNSPHHRTFRQKLLSAMFVIALSAALWGMECLYGRLPAALAALDVAAYVSVLSLAGYWYWNIYKVTHSLKYRLIIGFGAQAAALSVAWLFLTAAEWNDFNSFLHLVPLHLIAGGFMYVILDWRHVSERQSEAEKQEHNPYPQARRPEPASTINGAADRQPEIAPPSAATVAATPKNAATPQSHESAPRISALPPVEYNSEVKPALIERISVKQGSKISIIKVEEVIYIQAYGDYVLIFTHDGRHIKEQTMRYFESSLPDNFVRIHRSHIVNTEYVARVELFGKDNYKIHLKNGVSLKASATGYKAFRQRLNL